MSIRDAAFQLCKTVAGMPAQSESAEAIRGIRNTRLNYLGHGYQAQAFGFLVIDNQRELLEAPPRSMKIEPLAVPSRNVLSAYHNAVLDLNARCVKPLSAALPNCSSVALSPYNRFAPIPLGSFTPMQFFPEAEVEALVAEFNRHPLIRLAIDGASALPQKPTQEEYIHLVLHLEEDIRKAFPSDIPDQVEFVSQNSPPTSRAWLELQHIAAVAGLRASLSILNQLIYTTVFASRLPCIDETNIIKFGVYHFATGVSKVVYQETGRTFGIEREDIIILKDAPPREEVTNFCRVERLSPTFFSMPGDPRYIELVEIDENLNPYRRVLHHFYN